MQQYTSQFVVEINDVSWNDECPYLGDIVCIAVM